MARDYSCGEDYCRDGEMKQSEKDFSIFWYCIAFIAWIAMAYWAIRLGQQNVYDNLDKPPVSEYEIRGGSCWGN